MFFTTTKKSILGGRRTTCAKEGRSTLYGTICARESLRTGGPKKFKNQSALSCAVGRDEDVTRALAKNISPAHGCCVQGFETYAST